MRVLVGGTTRLIHQCIARGAGNRSDPEDEGTSQIGVDLGIPQKSRRFGSSSQSLPTAPLSANGVASKDHG